MESKTYILDALNAIPVATTNYQEWCNVGMALKLEGFGWQVWTIGEPPGQSIQTGELREEVAEFPWFHFFSRHWRHHRGHGEGPWLGAQRAGGRDWLGRCHFRRAR